MVNNISEIISTLGYGAINWIYGVDEQKLPEDSKKKLIQLMSEQENNWNLRSKIEVILEKDFTEPEKVDMLLDLVHINPKGE